MARKHDPTRTRRDANFPPQQGSRAGLEIVYKIEGGDVESKTRPGFVPFVKPTCKSYIKVVIPNAKCIKNEKENDILIDATI